MRGLYHIEVTTASGEEFNFDNCNFSYGGSIITISRGQDTLAAFGNPDSVILRKVEEDE